MSDFEINGTSLKKYAGQDKVVVVPEGITKIGQSAFSKNEVVEKIILPSSVKEIMKSAFSWCPNLKEINIIDFGCGNSGTSCMETKQFVKYRSGYRVVYGADSICFLRII